MTRRWSRRHRRVDPAEMDITAFMNLMVVLVPFLLITAVFSRLSILELNLPAGGAPPAEQLAEMLELEIVVREDRIEVADRNSGLLGSYPASPDGHDLTAVQEKLKSVKARFPDKIAATLLLEPDTSYETIVAVMDAMRSFRAEQNGRSIQTELFPEISIGDAPT